MLGRTWVRVVLIATLSGCVSESRLEPFPLDTNIPLECATNIRLVDCDLSLKPRHCGIAAVTYPKGCEQEVVDK